MAIDFTPESSAAPSSDGIDFTPEGGGGSYVAPGDVAAAKAKLGVSGDVKTGFTNALPENVARERLTKPGLLGQLIGIGDQFAQGIGTAAEGLGELATTNPFQGPAVPSSNLKEAVGNIAASPIGKTALGIGQAMASPFAPLSDVASSIGEGASNFMQKLGFSKAADVAGAVGQSAADVLAPMAATKYVDAAIGLAKGNPAMNDALLQSNRMKAASAQAELAASEKASTDKLAQIAKDTEQGKQFVSQVAEEQKANIPTAAELKAKFAPNAQLGEQAGKDWQGAFSQAWENSKKRFNKLYGDLTGQGMTEQVVPTNYVQAGGVLEGNTGITGTPSTQAERIAARVHNTVDLSKFEDDTYAAVKKQLDSVPAWDKQRVQGVLDEVVKNGGIPPDAPTMTDLILERQRLKAVQRAAPRDYDKHQLDTLIGGIESDIASANPQMAKQLFSIDHLYATEHAPYFSKGAITRSIAEKDPTTIVDALYRPTVGAGGRVAPNSRAVEAMTRAKEVITDPKQWDAINQAFLNKGIESAMEGGQLNQKGFVKWWQRYADPANTDSKVLRMGLGDKTFNDIQATVNQMQRTTPQTIDQYAKQLNRSLEEQGRVSAATVQAAQRLTRDRLVARIAQATGASTEQVTNRLQSIGSGVFVSGVMRGATATMLEGAGIVMGSKALAAVLGSVRGRNPLKALLRSAPGTAERASAARRLKAFIDDSQQQGE